MQQPAHATKNLAGRIYKVDLVSLLKAGMGLCKPSNRSGAYPLKIEGGFLS